MAVKNYIFAGLDFIFDKHMNPWFIEANSAPAFDIVETVYGEPLPVKEISEIMNKGENPCILLAQDEEWKRIINSFRLYMKDFYVCSAEENRKNRKKLKTVKDKTVRPTSIFRYGYVSRSFERSGVLVINPRCVRDITYDKIRTFESVANLNLRIPHTYIIFNNHDLRWFLKKEKYLSMGFVIKPIKGQMGYGVHIFKRMEHLPKLDIRKREMLEQLILPRKHHQNYWNIRTYVVNGKFNSAVVRSSKNIVVNVTRGARVEKPTEEMIRKVKRQSEKIVKAIDRETERIKYD